MYFYNYLKINPNYTYIYQQQIQIESMFLKQILFKHKTEVKNKIQQLYYNGMSQNSEILHWQN